VKRWEITAMAAFSIALVGGAWLRLLPLDLTEVFGFVTGVVCVWLTVREQIWNWPIGLVNSAFYVALFLRARLFADMGLQVIYIVLGVLGWYWWLRGGAQRRALRIGHASGTTWLVLGALVAAGTAGLTLFLRSVGDVAPFLDALTTALSLAAQYLLTRKALENWYVWIAADIIYIGLYFAKGLPLTAVLYVLLLTFCLAGLRQWRQALAQRPAAAPAIVREAVL
jgi:nicotinamide mononucleotide transporter